VPASRVNRKNNRTPGERSEKGALIPNCNTGGGNHRFRRGGSENNLTQGGCLKFGRKFGSQCDMELEQASKNKREKRSTNQEDGFVKSHQTV